MLPRRQHAQRPVAVLYGLRPRLRRHELCRVFWRSFQAGRLRCGRDCTCQIVAGAEVRRHLRAAAAVIIALDAARAQCQSMSYNDDLFAVDPVAPHTSRMLFKILPLVRSSDHAVQLQCNDRALASTAQLAAVMHLNHIGRL